MIYDLTVFGPTPDNLLSLDSVADLTVTPSGDLLITESDGIRRGLSSRWWTEFIAVPVAEETL